MPARALRNANRWPAARCIGGAAHQRDFGGILRPAGLRHLFGQPFGQRLVDLEFQRGPARQSVAARMADDVVVPEDGDRFGAPSLEPRLEFTERP